MRKLCLALLPLFLLFTVCACEDDIHDEDNGGANVSPIENNDEYYVQYSASINLPYQRLVTIQYTTEKGEVSVKDYRSASWGETIGPVKKGFRAWIKVGNDRATCKISVSKNNSAFAVKATGTQSASFTINY